MFEPIHIDGLYTPGRVDLEAGQGQHDLTLL